MSVYLFFDGRCEEALAFYKKAIGAEISMLMRFKENPEAGNPSAEGCAPGIDPEKVMHAAFRVGKETFMASDGRCGGKPKFEGFSLSLSAKDEAEAERFFNGLAEGGTVQMPLTKTFFSPKFGMVADKFGLSWMVIVEHQA